MNVLNIKLLKIHFIVIMIHIYDLYLYVQNIKILFLCHMYVIKIFYLIIT